MTVFGKKINLTQQAAGNMTRSDLNSSKFCLTATRFKRWRIIFRNHAMKASYVKLAIKFGRPDIVKRFLASERTGFYFAVLQEGEVGAGDPIELIERNEDSLRVSDIAALYAHEKHNVDLLRRAIAVAALPESWRNYFQHRLAKLTSPLQD